MYNMAREFSFQQMRENGDLSAGAGEGNYIVVDSCNCLLSLHFQEKESSDLSASQAVKYSIMFCCFSTVV